MSYFYRKSQRWEVKVNFMRAAIGKIIIGDIVQVHPTFMRHELHPSGKAAYATEEKIKEIFLPLACQGQPLKIFNVPVLSEVLLQKNASEDKHNTTNNNTPIQQ